MVNAQYSNRSPSGISTSVQKRRTLYLAQSDPRVRDGKTISRYQNDYYAEVIVLSDADYIKLLSNELGLQQLDSASDLLESPISGLYPPTSLYWDYPNDTEFVPTTSGNEVNIIVSFNPGDNPVSGLTYRAIVTANDVGATGTSTAFNINPAVVSETFQISEYGPNGIEISWKGDVNALAYTIDVVGADLPLLRVGQPSVPFYSSSPKRTYVMNYDTKVPGHLYFDSQGRVTFRIEPRTSVFSGNYTVTVQPTYTKNSGTIRTLTFNVDNHAIPIQLDGVNYANN